MKISDELEQIMKSSTFKVCDGEWTYAKVQGTLSLEDCFMVSRDEDETTAVFEQSKKYKFEILEENKDSRKLIEIAVSVPFYSVGFLATISQAIAGKGMS